MLKAAGEEGVELARQLIETVFSCSVITSDWEGSFILNLYKGKGEALGRGNYRDLKLTDQVMKLHEQVLDSYIREMVNINEMALMQLEFVLGKGTTGVIFAVRQLQGRYIAANKLCNFACADPQKAFDHVSRKVLWRALKVPRGCGMGCACHSSHVLQCPVSYAGQWSIQLWVCRGS